MNAIILVDICATGYGFIEEKFAEILYQMFEIATQHMMKPKLIQ